MKLPGQIIHVNEDLWRHNSSNFGVPQATSDPNSSTLVQMAAACLLRFQPPTWTRLSSKISGRLFPFHSIHNMCVHIYICTISLHLHIHLHIYIFFNVYMYTKNICILYIGEAMECLTLQAIWAQNPLARAGASMAGKDGWQKFLPTCSAKQFGQHVFQAFHALLP